MATRFNRYSSRKPTEALEHHRLMRSPCDGVHPITTSGWLQPPARRYAERRFSPGTFTRGKGGNLIGTRQLIRFFTGCVPVGVLPLLLTSCGGIEEARNPTDLPTWTLGEPALTLGSIDGGPDAFSPIRALEVGPDGDVYLLLSQEHRVAVFSESGSVVGSLGREGEGPGEFSFPWDLGFIGDTLWVLDPRAQRVSFFRNLEVIGSASLSPPRDIHPERNARAVALLRGGGVLIVTDSQSPLDPAVPTTPSLILVQRAESLDTLATYSTDYTAGFAIKRSGGTISAVRPFPQPFSKADYWAVSPDGARVLLVRGGPVGPDSESSHYSATVFRPTGDTVFSVRVPYQPIPMPDHVQDVILGDLAGERFTVDEMREAAYLPSEYPPVSTALIGQNGRIWIGREAIPDAPLSWDVLSPEGERLARVATPVGFDLKAVAEDHFWGLVHDGFDVPYVVRRPVHQE